MQQLPADPNNIYEVQQTKEKADAVAYAFLDKGDPVQYPFKFKSLADEEVRIQITFTGLCQSDAHTVRGKWGGCKLPACPGHEVVGYVSLVGSKVTSLKKGDRVGCGPFRNYCGECAFCKKGEDNLCEKREGLYVPYFGGYSTHIQLFARSVHLLPKGFKEELGSPLLCAGVTVHAPIKKYVKRNGTCAVIGIGGLGHLALQYAAKMGMIVTAFTSSTNKVEEANSFGASFISSSIDFDSLTKEQGKYDLVVNTLAICDPVLFKAYIRLTKPGGTYVQVGVPDANDKMNLDHTYIIFNQIRVCGSIVGSYRDTQDMLEFSNEHNIYPQVETFQFEDFPKAFKLLEHGRPKFRCVVDVLAWSKANGMEK